MRSTLTPVLRPDPLAELFTRRARHHGDAVAVGCAGETLTYAELDRRSNRLAHRLRRAGVGPETQVALAMERGVDRIVALLAVVKAGGAYVPLDADYPAERLAHMLSVTGVGLLVSQRRVAEHLAITDLPTLLPFDDGEGGRGEGVGLPADEPPAVRHHPDQLAYVNFTSGSTGKPKGVAVPQRAVARLATPLGDPEVESFADLGPGDVVLQLAPLSFDAATLEVWGALLNGARLEVFPPGKPSLAELARVIREAGVTTLWLTAGLFHQMVDNHPEAFAGVRQLLAGGDVLSALHVAAALAAVAPGGRVVNGYGPTENTTFTTCHVMRPEEGFDAGSPVPIGRAVPGTRVVLLDGAGLPTDGDGELATGGDGLARGYLGRPAETALRFVPDPTPGRDGERLYRTGDRARTLEGGDGDAVYGFLGRLDDQVKVRGFRVEPGEIESALAAHPRVGRAAVLALPTASATGGAGSAGGAGTAAAGDKRLVAYLATDGPAVPAPELRAFLAERLPDWMVPAAFVHLDELPLGPTGKVDRRALAAIEPGAARPDVSTPFVAPRNDLERRVAEVFAEMLGLDEVGVEDDLFELGGHSLALTRVVARLREIFAAELPIAAMFESPTVAAAAALVEAEAEGGSGGEGGGAATAPAVSGVAPPRPEPRPPGEPFEPPLAFPQHRVWFLQNLDPESLAYNFQARLDFRGDLHVPALRRALEDVVGRHEAFRTSFPDRDGEPVQVIHPAPGPGAPWRVELPLVDLAALPAQRRRDESARRMLSIYKRPYDMARLPLVYWVLFRLAGDDHELLHCEHHLIHDGWSFNVFLEDFAAFYRARVLGGEAELAPMPVQFADFALWQHRWEGSADYHRQLDYWRQQLGSDGPRGEVEDLDVPIDHPRPSRQTFVGRVYRRPLPAELTAPLRELARREGSSLFITLLTAYFTLLHRYSGQTGFCVGTGIANRRFKELERVIGMLINTVVLRGELEGDPTFRQALARTGAVAHQAYAHQDVSLDQVVDAVSPARDGSRNPLFQTFFSFHDAPLADIELPELEMDTLVGLSNGSAKFELSIISVLPREQGVGAGRRQADEAIDMLWEYNTDLFDAATVEGMFRHYQNLLRGLLDNPDLPLSRLPMLGEEERRQVLGAWAEGGPAAQSDAATLAEAVWRQAERTPEAAAVYGAAGEEWSYGELTRRAGVVARRLVDLGVGPETRVAVCLERTPRLLAAILGALAAGAAYVPLDPRYPARRLELMLEDSASAVALVEAATAEVLPAGFTGTRLAMEELDLDGGGSPSLARPVGVDPANLAYLIYTSGSTGRPKGVAIAHASAAAMVAWAGERYSPQERAGVLAATSVCFDLSVYELFATLAHGGAVVLAADALALADHPRADRVTLVNTVPSVMAELLAGAGLPPSVRTVNLAGEALPRSLADDVYATGHVADLYNLYGPSEDTTYSTWRRVPAAGEDGGGGKPEIGRPLPGSRAYVLDRHLEPVPAGVPGELWLAGAGLARGYLGRPGLTADRWRPDPFAGPERPGARAYRTGDLVRWLAPGSVDSDAQLDTALLDTASLDYLGRLDHQVKLRGFRIELGEVESALREQPEVGQAAVVARQEEGAGTLVGFVTLAPGVGAGGDAPDPGELIGRLNRRLERRLPHYMVPSALVVLDELPMTANDKVDRRALGRLAADTAVTSEVEYVAPRNDMEEVLVGIWAELVCGDRIGVHDNFFDLGGHSLHASRHMYRVRELLGVEMPLRTLYQAPTVEALAVRVEEALMAELEGLSDEELMALSEEEAGQPVR